MRNTEGKEITVFGVLEAQPRGLVIMVSENGRLITVDWRTFDMEHIRSTQPQIYAAFEEANTYQKAVPLKLGGFEGVKSYEDCIQILYHSLERDREYPLPESMDHIFEDDPDVIRVKDKDRERYTKIMRNQRRELQGFLQKVFPKDSVIIDDNGKVHHKSAQAETKVTEEATEDGGETSLGIIIAYLADDKNKVSRVGIDYLEIVSPFRKDFNATLEEVRNGIPNDTFKADNTHHTALPRLLDETKAAADHVLSSHSLHRSEQRELATFYETIYDQAEALGITYKTNYPAMIRQANLPSLDL